MRRIPIRLPPIDGESLDSWIAAYAARLETPIRDVASAIGMNRQFIAQPARLIATGERAQNRHREAGVGGLSAMEFEALWLPCSRYAAFADRRFAKTPLARLVRPLRWSRFCPVCLADNGGRWAALWRLPWWSACPTHQCLLSSACDTCGGHQRERLLVRETEQSLATCSAPVDRSARGAKRSCGSDLTLVAAEAAPTEVLDAQRPLADLLDPGIADDKLAHGIEQLADVLTVARSSGLIRMDSSASGLVDLSSMALALSLAQKALADPAGRILPELALADVRTRPHPLPRPWRTAGPGLVSQVLTIRDPHLRPTDRLRWRTTTLGTRPRSLRSREAFTRSVPHALWIDWAVRLRPLNGVEASSFRLVAAAALLLPGATEPIQTLVAGWTQNPSSFAHKLSHVLFGLTRHGHGREALRAITQLSDALACHGSPIDYQRRRQVASSVELLDPLSWDRICASAGTPTGGERKLRNARLWLWETITGGLVQRAPEPVGLLDPTGLTTYYDFALHLLPAEVEQLDGHARRLLDEQGCVREPLTWSPPTEWVDLDDLPGSDPDSVDQDEVGHLLRRPSSPSDVAEQLGISIDHVRLVMRRNPQDLRPAPKRLSRNPVPSSLNPDRLRELIIDHKETIRSISRDFGVSRKTVTGAVRREGLPVPPTGSRARHEIDPEWLRTEYVDRHRTLPDLAAEAGMAPTNLSRVARQHGIPLRERGGASHQLSLRAPAAFPEPLASAVLGQAGIERVRRFQVFARTPSLNQAVGLLGVTQATLSNQLAQLEKACEGPLLVRSPRSHRPQQVTPLGRQLLDQADELLSVNPEAPKDLPEPMATALASFWGEDRIRRFQVAARMPTLADAARHFGTDPNTFDRSLRGLEAACGQALLMRESPRRPHVLTRTGALLLEQADEHFGKPAAVGADDTENCVILDGPIREDGVRGPLHSAAG